MTARIEGGESPRNRACEASHDNLSAPQTRNGSRSARSRGGDRRGIEKKPGIAARWDGRNSLVAVGLPDHHGVGVGGLAGGDGGGLVEDGGDGGESGHFDC